MGIFDFIEKSQKKVIEKQEEITNKVNDMARKLSLTQICNIESSKKVTKKSDEKRKIGRTEKKIIETFYADYPEKPYISKDRPSEWIQRAKTFPQQCLVKKSMMKRYADGLLPGHVYMLYWLKKYTNKKVPSYFEYKYGIDFESEKIFLLENGFVDENYKPTKSGEQAIKKHENIIENHNAPKVDRSSGGVAKLILKQRENLQRQGFTKYEFIANRNRCDICAALDGKHFDLAKLEIGVNAPPMHDGCSCSIAALEDKDEYNAWLDHIANGSTTARRKNKRK